MFINIITVCFNNLTGLKKTYKSILGQSYNHFNWMVIDGKSNDGTVEFLEQVKQENQIEIIYKSEDDDGIYDAMNKGIDLSNGDYLLFLNAGDELSSDNVLSDVFDNRKHMPSIIYGNYYRELKNGDLALIKAKPIRYIYHSLPTSHQAIFYNRSAIDTLRYRLDYHVSSDYYFTSQLMKNLDCIAKKDYVIINKPIAVFEYNGMSRNNLSGLYKDAFDIQKEVWQLNIIFRIFSYMFKYLRNKFL